MLSSEQIEDAKFKAGFPLPAFHKAAEIRFLGVQADSNGRLFAFLQYPRDWMHVPLSARPSTNGQALELGIRMRWSDERPEPPVGDYRFFNEFEVEKEPSLVPLLKTMKPDPDKWIGAVELPFRPDTVAIIDR